MVPTDLTVIGDTTAGTILDGVGVASVDGFEVVKKLTLKNLTIQDFRYGVHVSQDTSTLTMTDVVLTANTSNGIYVDTMAKGPTINVLGMKTLITQTSCPALSVYNVPSLTTNLTDATLHAASAVVS